MGIPAIVGGPGRGLGAAVATISIDTSRARQAVPDMRGIAQGVVQAAQQMDAAVQRVQRSTNSLTTTFSRFGAVLRSQGFSAFIGTAASGGLGGVLSAAAGGGLALAAGLAAGTAVQRTSAAVSRQLTESIQAALTLEETLNKTNVAFDRSSGTILRWSEASAQAMGQSQQQALEAAAGFGLMFRSMGLTSTAAAQMSKDLVQLAADLASINNISPEEALIKLRAGLVGETEPLRTVGVLLNATAVEAKALEMGLARTASQLSESDKVLARYQLILEQTALSQGDFARTSGSAANLQRILTAEVRDLQAELGKAALPAYVVGLKGAITAVQGLSNVVSLATEAVERYARAWDVVITTIRRAAGADIPSISQQDFIEAMRATDVGRHRIPGRSRRAALDAEAEEIAEQRAAIEQEAGQEIADLQRNAQQQRLDAIQQFEDQRAGIIRDHGIQLAREAEDFARQRARAEADFAEQLLEIREEAARREADLADRLAENLAKIREDAEARIADLERAHAEQVASLREDSQQRLVELEQDYQRQRQQSLEDHRDQLLNAAARLDAVAVAAEQRRFARESRQAEENFAAAKDKERQQLRDRLADLERAHQIQIERERRQLEERLTAEQEAYADQLQELREIDARRIEDLRQNFEEQKRVEDENRALQLQRLAEDHNRQLEELDRQHALRLTQISQHEEDQRQAIREKYTQRLVEAKAATDAMVDEWERGQAELSRIGKQWINDMIEAMEESLRSRGSSESLRQDSFAVPRFFQEGGLVRRTGWAMVHAGEQVLTPAQRFAYSGDIHTTVVIGDLGGHRESRVRELVEQGTMEALQRVFRQFIQ